MVNVVGCSYLCPAFAESAKDYFEQGVADLVSGNYAGAIESLEAAVAINPNVAQIHNVLGVAYSQGAESSTDALRSFRRALALDPNLSDAYFNLGSLYAGHLHDLILAEENFEKALELNSKSTRALARLGWLYLHHKEDAQSAVHYFERCLAIDANQAMAQYGLGLAYALEGKRSMVIKPISELKRLGENEWARQLESMIQDKRDEADEGQKSKAM